MTGPTAPFPHRALARGWRAAVLLLAGLTAGIATATGEDAASGSERQAFEAANRIFQARCATGLCHAGPQAARGLRLDGDRVYRSTVNVQATSDRRRALVVPGSPDRSLLYQVLLEEEERSWPVAVPRMPEKGPPLSAAEIETVKRWITSFPVELWGSAEAASEAGGDPGTAVRRTFRDGRLAQLPTTEGLTGGQSMFRISHRFREAAGEAGASDLYGLDGGAWISLALSAGVGERVEIGLQHTNFRDGNEIYVKVALLRQQPDGPPVSLSYRGGISRLGDSDLPNRSRGNAQIVVARRFGRRFSGLLVPTYSTRTNYLDGSDTDGTLALGLGGELRLSRGVALTGEWIGQLDGVEAPYESFSLGVNLGSPRHGFHVVLTNTEGLHPDLYAPGGDLDWSDGDFRLGFNIMRVWGRP